MACTTAWLIEKPEIEEITESEVARWDYKKKVWIKHYEPFLIPQYRVTFIVDFGFCCGVDSHTKTFSSAEETQKAIDEVYANQHPWIKYNPEYMEDATEE